MARRKRVPFHGPKKSRFSGPTPSNAPRNDVAPLKTVQGDPDLETFQSLYFSLWRKYTFRPRSKPSDMPTRIYNYIVRPTRLYSSVPKPETGTPKLFGAAPEE
jgi:hypothetical protein